MPQQRPASAAAATGIRQRTRLHIAEWVAEACGTGLLVFGGLSAVCLDFGPHSWVADHIPSVSMRLLITGLLFAGTGSLVAVSPLGRLSGAHLNPVVTLAFRITGMVHPHDLVGYIIGQAGGAFAGAAMVRLLWGHVAAAIGYGVTEPSASTPVVVAVFIEASMTAILLVTILGFLSQRRLAAWTPVAVWIVVALLVWKGAPYTGTSLNPARSLGPALVAGNLADYWVYIVGPAIGAVGVAVAASRLGMRPLSAKLCPDMRYPSTLGSELPLIIQAPTT